MTQEGKDAPVPPDLARARIEKRHWFSLVWVVPVAAAIVAGWLVFDRVRRAGPLITILFPSGDGVQAGQTALRYRGVRVGGVKEVQLTSDARQVEVKARLDRSAKTLAREGSIFWVVRPQVGAAGIAGLDTIISGSYIEVEPGQGREQTRFVGAERAPILKSEEGSLELVVITSDKQSLNQGSPVYYRGMEVGKVRYIELNEDATAINVHVLIENRFAPLVRTDTRFWNAGGINVSLKLFSINLSAESAKSLLVGGIAFATPDPPGPRAAPGNAFILYDKPDEKWLKWAPRIPGMQGANTAENPSSSNGEGVTGGMRQLTK